MSMYGVCTDRDSRSYSTCLHMYLALISINLDTDNHSDDFSHRPSPQ